MHYSLTRATIWNLSGYIYLLIASFISTPVLLHSLGLADFGLYSLIIASVTIVSAINLGLPQSVVRALVIDHQFSAKRRTIWATSSLLFVLTGILAGLVAAILTSFNHVSPTILLLVFATGLINNLVSHYLTLPQAEGHFGYFNTKTFIIGTGNTLLAALLAWKGQGIAVIMSSQLLCYLITLLILAYFSLKYFPHPRQGKISRPVAKSIITFGLKNWGGKLVGQVQANYAKYLLAAASPITLSAYVIGQGLVSKAAGGVVQLATALYPASTSPRIRPLYYRLQAGLLLSGFLIIWCYSLFGFAFLAWWLQTPELVNLVDSVMKILVWYFAILILTPLPSTLLDGAGRPELSSMFALITTIIEIGLAIALFPQFGLFAPVYAAVIGVAVTTPALLYVTNKVLNKGVLPQSKPYIGEVG